MLEEGCTDSEIASVVITPDPAPKHPPAKLVEPHLANDPIAHAIVAFHHGAPLRKYRLEAELAHALAGHALRLVRQNGEEKTPEGQEIYLADWDGWMRSRHGRVYGEQPECPACLPTWGPEPACPHCPDFKRRCRDAANE